MIFSSFTRLLPHCAWQRGFLLGLSTVVGVGAQDARDAASAFSVVPKTVVESHVAAFNAMEDEPVINLVPNAGALAWLAANVPRFTCADPEVEEIYWFRWWALRKQLRIDEGSGKRVFTEFITRARPVSSALGHHLREGRWFRDSSILDDYMAYWLRGNSGKPQEHLHRFSQWMAFALWERWKVTQDTATLTDLLGDLVDDHLTWEREQQRADGLFWQYDVRDAMEESISGGRKVKNVRPTISSYMYGNAEAIAAIADLAGRADLAASFREKARVLREQVQVTLWNASLAFFGSVDESLQPIAVREAIGFIPWYFSLPEKGRGYEVAWSQFTDTSGFRGPRGLMTAERRHPQFRSHGVGTCEWDGAVWPFATSQTLTALANVLQEDRPAPVTSRDYFDAFLSYTRSHRFDGKPYIGEYLDETTGAWLKGPDPRSRWYNHSTYADLVISGLVGLRPAAGGVVELHPLLPEGSWAWFCLDGVRYHGHDLTVLWDKDGSRFKKGAGLQIWIDGKLAAQSPRLAPLTAQFPVRNDGP